MTHLIGFEHWFDPRLVEGRRQIGDLMDAVTSAKGRAAKADAKARFHAFTAEYRALKAAIERGEA